MQLASVTLSGVHRLPCPRGHAGIPTIKVIPTGTDWAGHAGNTCIPDLLRFLLSITFKSYIPRRGHAGTTGISRPRVSRAGYAGTTGVSALWGLHHDSL